MTFTVVYMNLVLSEITQIINLDSLHSVRLRVVEIIHKMEISKDTVFSLELR